MLNAAMGKVWKVFLYALTLAALGVLPKFTHEMGQAASEQHKKGMMSLSAFNHLLESGGKTHR